MKFNSLLMAIIIGALGAGVAPAFAANLLEPGMLDRLEPVREYVVMFEYGSRSRSVVQREVASYGMKEIVLGSNGRWFGKKFSSLIRARGTSIRALAHFIPREDLFRVEQTDSLVIHTFYDTYRQRVITAGHRVAVLESGQGHGEFAVGPGTANPMDMDRELKLVDELVRKPQDTIFYYRWHWKPYPDDQERIRRQGERVRNLGWSLSLPDEETPFYVFKG